MRVLVLNAGSSSLKWQLFDGDELLRDENVQRWDPDGGFDEVIDAVDGLGGLDAVGHRVVHGGPKLREPTIVDDAVVDYLATTIDLAPLHQPPALAGIVAARAAFPRAVHVACFDTSFHETLSAAAYTYALPAEWNSRWNLRRYGFHGLSHAYAFAAGARLAQVDPNARILTAHLGAGASLCAVSSGRSVDTTMGFTPLEGLVMRTRSGDVDPGLLLWLLEHTELTVAEVFDGLEHSSGLAGLSGTTGDMRDVLAGMQAGHDAPRVAWSVFNHRLAGLAGQMITAMGGVDLVVFTGGVGEHQPRVRSSLCDSLSFLGVTIDEARNEVAVGDAVISGARSTVAAVVVTAREDLQIMREVHAVMAASR
ncbi:MAG: acetate/propionate family kinase [Candidatus Nanopelagicales bacterium]